MILYGKGDLNIKAANEFSQVEALCPKWWGRERARLKGIAAIAQCQGTAERWPLVAGITNRQINFWSPRARLKLARCGEVSYLVTPASHKSQRGQIMCKNCLFSSFHKKCWGKKKSLKRPYLQLISNQNAQCLGCWLQPVKLWGFQGTASHWHPLSVPIKGILLLVHYHSPSAIGL